MFCLQRWDNAGVSTMILVRVCGAHLSAAVTHSPSPTLHCGVRLPQSRLQQAT